MGNPLKQKSAPVITCKDVSKDFYVLDEHLNWRIFFKNDVGVLTPFHALQDVSIEVPKGQFVGILGRNGAGKSTLLRILGGIYPPSKGIVQVNGTPSSLFEMGGFGNDRLTGFGYADRYLEIYGTKKKNRHELIENIKGFSELGDAFNKPIYTYSSGMGARLYFATATELQHDIYLIDELLSVGDEYFQAKCWKRLRERFSNGASGILVTHDWAAVIKICSKAYLLERGKIVGVDSAEKMVQRYLNLPVPQKTHAEIITPSEGYTLASGQDADIQFDIHLKQDIPLAISYSVELFRLGHGWELILLNENFVSVQCRLGKNKIRLKLNKLPLAPGKYYLNLFLKSTDGKVDSLALDSRTWTHGNGIELVVEGTEHKGVVTLPWTKQVKVDEHVTA